MKMFLKLKNKKNRTKSKFSQPKGCGYPINKCYWCNFLFILFLIFMYVPKADASEPVIIKASVDKNKITIGDKVIFLLKVSANKDIELLPLDLSTYFKAFEIKEHSQEGPKASWGKTKLEYKLVLTTFTTGTYEISPILVKYKLKTGEEKEIKSEKINIQVESIKPDPKDKDDIRDIKPPQSLNRQFIFYAVIVLVLLVVTGVFFLVRYLKNKNINKVMETAEPERSAHVIAYERLKKLGELNLVKEGKIKEYYIILSEIIRSYLEKRFNVPVVERTTSEAFRELKSVRKISRDDIGIIKGFLEESDLVKFAKYIPEENAINGDYQTAVGIVDKTKEKEEKIAFIINTDNGDKKSQVKK